MEQIVQFLSQLDPVWVYVAIFLIAFIENIFPPFPSDIMVVFGGALAAIGKGSLIIAVSVAVIGSTAGFILMFIIGKWFGKSIVESGKLKFLPLPSIHKTEEWFARYGYALIVANRFLAGTRAVISFFAGMSNLDFTKTIVLSFLSSLFWNSILVYAGHSLAENWQMVESYLSTYSLIVTILLIAILATFIIRYILLHRKKR